MNLSFPSSPTILNIIVVFQLSSANSIAYSNTSDNVSCNKPFLCSIILLPEFCNAKLSVAVPTPVCCLPIIWSLNLVTIVLSLFIVSALFSIKYCGMLGGCNHFIPFMLFATIVCPGVFVTFSASIPELVSIIGIGLPVSLAFLNILSSSSSIWSDIGSTNSALAFAHTVFSLYISGVRKYGYLLFGNSSNSSAFNSLASLVFPCSNSLVCFSISSFSLFSDTFFNSFLVSFRITPSADISTSLNLIFPFSLYLVHTSKCTYCSSSLF